MFNQLKKNISGQISQRRIVVGILLGFLWSIVISLGLNYGREALRILSANGDLYILKPAHFAKYDFFFSLIASLIGLCICISIWMSAPNKTKNKRRKNWAAQFPIWIAIIVLLALTRLGTLFHLVVFTMPGYESNLSIIRELPLILILLPIYIFFAAWNPVRLLFQSRKWMWLSYLVVIINATFLLYTTTVDRSIVNEAYYKNYEEELIYIKDEIKKAEEKEIVFPAKQSII